MGDGVTNLHPYVPFFKRQSERGSGFYMWRIELVLPNRFYNKFNEVKSYFPIFILNFLKILVESAWLKSVVTSYKNGQERMVPRSKRIVFK